MDDVKCIGLEYRLFDCPNRGIEVDNCGHSQDAGVVCIAGNAFIAYTIDITITLFQAVLKEKSDLWEEPATMKVVWRSASAMSGAQCVTRCGTQQML